MDTRLTSMAMRTAPRADRLSFFTNRPPRKIPRQAQGMAVIPETKNKRASKTFPEWFYWYFSLEISTSIIYSSFLLVEVELDNFTNSLSFTIYSVMGRGRLEPIPSVGGKKIPAQQFITVLTWRRTSMLPTDSHLETFKLRCVSLDYVGSKNVQRESMLA